MFVGHDARRDLNSGDLDVVRLRRSVRYLLTHDSVSYGVAVIAAYAAFVVPTFVNVKDSLFHALSIVAAIVFAGALIIFRLRSNVT